MKGERPLEALARRIVADVLEVPVRLHDDNSLPSMVDAMIESPEGEIPLEVVMDVAPAVIKQVADIARYPDGIPLPEGSPSWLVMMTRGSRTSRLAKTLPPLLAALDQTVNYARKTPTALVELGVHAISPTETNGPPRIFLSSEGVSYSGAGPDLNGYVERFLTRADDVPFKLARAAGAGRAHAFIWLTITSAYAGWAALRDSDRPLPSTAPDLPPGVTDVWLATTYVDREAIRYSPERGWERTGRTLTDNDVRSIYPSS